MVPGEERRPRVVAVDPCALETFRQIVTDGPTREQIAKRMGVPVDTVKSAMKRLYRAADVNNQVHLVLKVARGEIRLVER